MIFEQLILHDYAIYRGRHEIDLTPVSADKPIILIGGHNGRGKTTMLDAINLVLFGQRARLSNRKANTSWDKYLRDAINRHASGGALVGLRFVVEGDFESLTYEVSRSWEVSGKSVKEYFNVRVNDEPDAVLAEDWDNHIEGLLPIEVASLNFFDGEKIDRLADPYESRSVIDAAIKGLLGLGVLDRLEADLRVLLRRKDKEVAEKSESPVLRELDKEIDRLDERAGECRQELAGLHDEAEAAREELDSAEARALLLGKDKYEKRIELEAQRRDLEKEKDLLVGELHGYADDAAPLRLVRPLLQRMEAQMASDEVVQRAQILLEELVVRDRDILAALDADTAKVVEPLLANDRVEREQVAGQAMVHESPSQGRLLVSALNRSLGEMEQVRDLLKNIARLDSQIVDTERQLMAVPSEEQMAPIIDELARIQASLDDLMQKQESLWQEIEHIEQARKRQETERHRLEVLEAEKNQGEIVDGRSREYARRALDTVADLRNRTLIRNLAQIEAQILERFGMLIGKADLVTGVHIDRDTLELKVRTDGSEWMPIERLSAGERQLLATATLWGMSTVAGRSYPLVIDTPLGRLDANHRVKLVTRYFPHAAAQVIILSTDTEISGENYDLMKDAIGKEFLIQFDPESKSSGILPGYFQEVAHAG